MGGGRGLSGSGGEVWTASGRRGRPPISGTLPLHSVFALPGIFLLVLVDTLKPQEYVPLLHGFPLIYVMTALTLVGLVVDLRLGFARLKAAPQFWLAAVFVVWCVATAVPRGSGAVARVVLPLLIIFSLFVFVAQGIHSFRGLKWILGLILAIGLFLAAVGVHQAFAPWGCHRITYEYGTPTLTYDGRSCDGEGLARYSTCDTKDAEPGFDYQCERVGLFGTQSVMGRVRFRGTLQDPNELALAVAVVLPLAFAFFELRRSLGRLALLLVTLALTGVCVVKTQSRGGQIVMLLVLFVYFVRRYGMKLGAAAGGLAAVPVMLLGGRDTAEAGGSTMERLECWSQGLKMFRNSPLVGVGCGQFTEHHYLTAHNSYILTAAELGLPGMLLWTALLWLSIKIPVRVLREADQLGAPQNARTWALALLAALVAMAGGMAFLSYAYKELLWIYLGLSAALFQSVRRHAPAFDVSLDLRDIGGILAADVGLVVGLTIFTRLKLGY